MSGPFDRINPSSDDQSIGADLFRQWRRGDISFEDYLILNAANVAQNAYQERVKIYIPMPDGVRRYLSSRLSGGLYDQHGSKGLGDWRYDVYQALDHNRHMFEHFQWALDKCDSVKLETESEKLRQAIRRFEVMRFPAMEYQQAIDVQKMDSSHRERERRGV